MVTRDAIQLPESLRWPSTARRYAAVFIDFENVYYYLKNYYPRLAEPSDLILDMIRNLRSKMLGDRDERVIVMKAYADFERMKATPQGSMYLLGVETHNVLGTDHKNAADMRLCIDALEILYTRPEINTFIFLAGDRDYIPVIQHLTKQAKQVMAVAFREKFLSGDLLLNVGEENFIDAETLLGEAALGRLNEAKAEAAAAREQEERAKTAGPTKEALKAALRATPTTTFNRALGMDDEDERDALEILLRYFGHHPEVFLMPYLHKLRNEMPQLADYQRKALISNLEYNGAVKVERRQGEPNDYSVIIINWDHPTVRELNPGPI